MRGEMQETESSPERVVSPRPEYHHGTQLKPPPFVEGSGPKWILELTRSSSQENTLALYVDRHE